MILFQSIPIHVLAGPRGFSGGQTQNIMSDLFLTAVKDIIFCNQTGARRMCNNSRPRFSEDLVRDSMSDQRSDMLFAQSDFLRQIPKCDLAAYWESVC